MTDTIDPLAEAREVLQQFWGYDDFRPAQAEILPDILEGRDVLAIMPTGGGKSVLFQVPAMMDRGSTVVVSPLIALMKDQVDDCVRRGLTASYVNSHVDPDEAQKRFDDWVAGEYQLFYVAPERIRVRSFQDALRRARVDRVAVDEAHCAAQWGHDFRPAYARLHEIADAVEAASGRRPSTLAVTATATWDIEQQIAEALGLHDGYTRYVADPLRPNLSYEVYNWGSSWAAVRKLVPELLKMGGRHVVYVGTRAAASDVADIIEDATGHEVGVYHAGREQDERTDVQDAFKDGRTGIVVATSAFGMGIDVPDIRSVVHFGIPDSLESYTQQAGRAGRDGKPSRCILLADDRAASIQQFFLDNQNPPYEAFESVWGFLHLKLRDDQDVLRETVKEMAVEIGSKMRGARPSDTQVGTVLNTLEAHGLVERMYEAEATPIVVTVAQLRAAYKASKKSTYRNVVAKLAATFGINEHTPDPIIRGRIDRKALATVSGVSSAVVNTVLKKLAADGAVRLGETFVGKSTRVVKFGAKLDEYLPKQDILFKRDRASRRLAAMINYSLLPNEKTRIAHVRKYFMGE